MNQTEDQDRDRELSAAMRSDEEASTIDRNIAAVHRMRQDADDYRRRDQIFIDRVASFLGSTNSLYAHLIVYGSLFGAQYLESVAIPPSNRVTTGGISLAASLESIFLALFVLINQRHMAAVDRKNTDLHLQMSLLAEHEVTRIARVTGLIARHLGVSTATVENFEDVKKDVNPEEVLARIETHETENPTDSALATPKNRSKRTRNVDHDRK